MRGKRFTRTMAVTTIASVAFAAILSVAVDPYAVFGTPRVAGFNAVKPRAADQAPLGKTWAVKRANASTLLFGNSRIDVGFDPEAGLWPADMRPVFNFGLPGIGLVEIRDRLFKAAGEHSPRGVVLAVDFPDFLAAPGAADPAGPAAARPSGIRAVLRDMSVAVLSLDALWASAVTVARQHDGASPDMTELGFNPLRQYEAEVKQIGYGGLFAQKRQALAKRFAGGRFDLEPADGRDFAALRDIVVFCRDRGIALTVFLPPYHAELLDLWQGNGMGDLFEAWKRQVVAVIAGTDARVPVWDFAAHHRWAREPVPPPGDTRTVMSWYWELGHFKAALGEVLLGRMLGAPANHDLGCQLRPDTIETCLAEARRLRDQAVAAASAAEGRPAAPHGSTPAAVRQDGR